MMTEPPPGATPRAAREGFARSIGPDSTKTLPSREAGPWGRGSLRARLTLAVIALMAVVVALLTTVTGFALQAYLVADLDGELRGTAERAVRAVDRPELPGFGPGTAIGIPGQAPGTLAAIVDSGALTLAAVLDQYGESDVLDASEAALLATELDGRQIGSTFDAEIGDRGGYRFTSVQLDDGKILVLGLPLGEVDGVLGQYWWLAAVVGLGVLVVSGGGAWLIGSALQRTTARLETALAAREASEARLRRFAADASHELRTPLASIRGYAELTRRSGARLRKDVEHSLGRIESESKRMTSLVEDLLLLARLDESQPLAAQPVELAELVATAVGDVQVSAPEHAWSVEAPAPVEVIGDAAKLQQATVNLLANAATHTPPGTEVIARVRVEAGEALIEVEDDGPGISAELLPSVFGRFVRGDAARTRQESVRGTSTGLGLAIVEAIVVAHGGTAELESAPGRTIVRLRLPLGTPV